MNPVKSFDWISLVSSFATCVYIFKNIVGSRKFEVLGARDFILKSRKFELQGGRHKNVKSPKLIIISFLLIKPMFWVHKRIISGRRFFYAPKTFVFIESYKMVHKWALLSKSSVSKIYYQIASTVKPV